MTSNFVSRMSDTTPALRYLEGPTSGPTLVLLHGVTRNATDWEPLLPLLAPYWHIIALDQRGHGQSEWARNAYLVIDYARDAAAFVEKHCPSPVTVLGHSLGAMVAHWLAAECSERIKCVVLEDPPFHTMGRRIGETPYQSQFAGMQQVARQELDDIESIADALSDIRLPSASGSIRLGDLRDRNSLRTSAGCLRLVDPEVFTPLVAGRWLDGFDYESFWSRVTCPTLLLQADPNAGGAFTDADVELARQHLRHHQHLRFDGVGHQIHGTRPQEVVTALHQFCGIHG